ncbi:MAG TPA: FHA domain-containing protein [Planctomycetaceae bacterium]|nr:FHA domain-containing protein [Planctomycetaceae bacterium]HQZ68210.1 FHA domain-containing protein [Planctomycetaceae bacterium]
MASVTLSVLEGLERGHIFRNLHTPITIGREEVNSVQLNDERISRLHAKLQEDQGHVIFTDLNSTNGSRVNGHPVQLRILRPGDHLQLGRCTLLFGSEQEIADRAKELGLAVDALLPLQGPHGRSQPAGGSPDAEFSLADNLNSEHMLSPLFPNERPPLPTDLTTLQQARMSDVLCSIHEQLQNVIVTAAEQDEFGDGTMDVPWDRFQNLLLLQRDLAKWIQQASNPDSD